MQGVYPLLKYGKGEVLSAEHWHELFHMLGLPRGTTLEKLAFGVVLSVADVILANSQGLMELLSKAQGEVSIREALRELELWGIGASFSLTGYKDSAGRELKLIKDGKDLVTR